MISLGDRSTAKGTYDLGGTARLTANIEYVGYSGAGTFTQSGGSNSLSLGLRIGYEEFNGSGIYTLSDGYLHASAWEYVGCSGLGTFIQSGGTNSISGNLCLAFQSTASGTYNLNGGVLAVQSLGAGAGSATFNFGGGTLQAGGSMSSHSP